MSNAPKLDLDEVVLDPHPFRPSPLPIPQQPRTLLDLAVSDELSKLFDDARSLLDAVLHDPEVPPNQRAQCVNSVMSVLERISKTRTELYNADRVQRIEQAILRVMKDQPDEIRQAFFENYKAALAD